MKPKIIMVFAIISAIWLIGCTDNDKIFQLLKEQGRQIELLREDIVEKPIIYKFHINGIGDVPNVLAKNLIFEGFNITLTKDNQTAIGINQLEVIRAISQKD